MRDVRFLVIQRYAFISDNALLIDLYSPIIGKSSSLLYNSLLNEIKKQTLTNGIATDLNDFLKQLGVSELEFCDARKYLEAMGLLNTYIDVDNAKNTTVYHFVLNEPLSFHDFISNQKYRHLLIKAVGQINYEKLEFFYGSARVSNNSTNVTATFESVFNDDEINKITTLNFDDLYRKLSLYASTPIIFDEKCKTLIESYFKAYDLSLTEIQRVITDAIVYTDDKIYSVDSELLKLKFDDFINGFKNVNILKNIKINRNAQMFVKHLNAIQLNDIYNDYMNINSEQYLRAIFKCPLTDEQIGLIKSLKKDYCLPDGIINLVIDFTLFKLNGKLNEKYIYKVAKTINALNYQTIQQVYDHFHFMSSVANTSQKPTMVNNGINEIE
jgi:replication initiation and membrane attachment protein